MFWWLASALAAQADPPIEHPGNAGRWSMSQSYALQWCQLEASYADRAALLFNWLTRADRRRPPGMLCR